MRRICVENSGRHHSFMSFSYLLQICTHAELLNVDQMKSNVSCDFFCEKILADNTVSLIFQYYLNFLPKLQLRNVSQMKNNVHDTHFC